MQLPRHRETRMPRLGDAEDLHCEWLLRKALHPVRVNGSDYSDGLAES
jgi:hypothetical protein